MQYYMLVHGIKENYVVSVSGRLLLEGPEPDCLGGAGGERVEESDGDGM